MSADVLREYLVALGWKIDQAGLKRFNTSLAGATKAVMALGATIAGVAVTVETAVGKIAEQMEAVYFASQKAGASVENIDALGYAASQAGVGAGAATGALQNLARAMRLNPGMEGFVGSLGVQTREANGKLRDTSKIMHDLVGQLRARYGMSGPGFAVAAQIAGQFGIDPDTLLMLEKNWDAANAAAQQYHDTLARAGLNENDAAETAHKFMVQLRHLRMEVGVLGEVMMTRLEPLAAWFLRMGERFVGALMDLDRATGGWSTTLGTTLVSALTAALVAWRLLNIGFLATPVGMIVAGIAAIGGAVYLLYEHFDQWKQASQNIIDWDAWRPVLDAAISWLGTLRPLLDQIAEAALDFAHELYDLASVLAVRLGPTIETVIRVLGVLVGAMGQALPGVIQALLTGALLGLRDGLQYIADIIRVVIDLLTGQWAKAWQDASKVGQDVIKGLNDAMQTLKDAVSSVWQSFKDLPGKVSDAIKQAPGRIAGAIESAPGAALNEGRDLLRRAGHAIGNLFHRSSYETPAPTGNAASLGAQAMAYFQRAGWTREQAAGLVGNIQRESGFNAGATGDRGAAYGIGQWHPDRQAAFARWSGHDIRQSTFAEQLAFMNYELRQGTERAAGARLAGATDAGDAGEIVSSYYERPADRLGEAAIRAANARNWYSQANLAPSPMQTAAGGGTAGGAGGGAPVINQSTTVNVAGSSDPQATAHAVASAQSRVNGNMVRNLASALT